MAAVRLARRYTGRTKIVKFEGCYHGHSDGLLARARSGLTTFGLPDSGGVPGSFAAETLVARFNDLRSVASLLEVHGGDVAGILAEPVAGNMGVVPPEPGFLQGLRTACDRTGALLLFDEVITGFRIAWGGAQERYGVSADLTTLGKIIGAGLPVGAAGGRREVMELLAPLADVCQAGTLSGNPLVAAAVKAALEALRELNPYEELELRAGRLAEGLSEVADSERMPLWIGRVGPMFTLFFAGGPVRDYASAMQADAGLYARFFRCMLERGVLLPPSQWEAAFLSACHLGDSVLQATASKAADALRLLGRSSAAGSAQQGRPSR